MPELVETDLWHQWLKIVSEGLLRVEGGPGARVDCLGEGGDPRQQLGRQWLGAFLCWEEVQGSKLFANFLEHPILVQKKQKQKSSNETKTKTKTKTVSLFWWVLQPLKIPLKSNLKSKILQSLLFLFLLSTFHSTVAKVFTSHYKKIHYIAYQLWCPSHWTENYACWRNMYLSLWAYWKQMLYTWLPVAQGNNIQEVATTETGISLVGELVFSPGRVPGRVPGRNLLRSLTSTKWYY